MSDSESNQVQAALDELQETSQPEADIPLRPALELALQANSMLLLLFPQAMTAEERDELEGTLQSVLETEGRQVLVLPAGVSLAVVHREPWDGMTGTAGKDGDGDGEENPSHYMDGTPVRDN